MRPFVLAQTILKRKPAGPVADPRAFADFYVHDKKLKQLKGNLRGYWYYYATGTSIINGDFPGGTYGKDPDGREYVKLDGNCCLVISLSAQPAEFRNNGSDFAIVVELSLDPDSPGSYLISQQGGGYYNGPDGVLLMLSSESIYVDIGNQWLVSMGFNLRRSVAYVRTSGKVYSAISTPSGIVSKYMGVKNTSIGSGTPYLFIGRGIKGKLYSVRLANTAEGTASFYR